MEAKQQAAAARSRAYWLLSRLFLEQPDADLLEEIAGAVPPGGESGLDGEAGALKASARQALASPAALTDLQVEYTRLLGSASRMSDAPEPYEAVAREGRLFGASTESVSAAYIAAGHEDLASVTGPPDHVGTELRFLALLCYREMEAWASADEEEAQALLSQQQTFLDEHVLAWVPSFCESIARLATHPFYVALARLTAAACVQDRSATLSFLDESLPG